MVGQKHVEAQLRFSNQMIERLSRFTARRHAIVACAMSLALAVSCAASAQSPTARGATGLPLPRFVSLKSDRVPVRQGPGTDHKILWVFNRVGMPVEVIQEHEAWRQIRDSEGATGWVIHSLLSARRTALVAPWRSGQPTAEERKTMISLLSDKDLQSRALAVLEPGIVTGVRHCDGQWCHVAVRDYRGYVSQRNLWGVYDGEIVK